MININNYILEKLHLSKDTKFEKSIKEGDNVICLAIDKGDGEIRLFKQYVNGISNENIIVTDDWGETNLDINHKYKKYTCDYGDWIYVLYNLSLGLELINEIIDYHPKLKFKTNIYDMHEFDINKWTDYPINYDELYIQKTYYNYLSEIKSELEHGSITEKLHLSKDTKIKIPIKEEFMKLLKNFKDGINLSQVFGKNNLPCDNHNHDVDIEEISVKKDLDGYDEIYYSYFDPFDGFENVRVLNLNIFSNNQILKIYTYMQDHIK